MYHRSCKGQRRSNTWKIFPPQPGQATLSLETLQFVLTDLGTAVILMILALQTA